MIRAHMQLDSKMGANPTSLHGSVPRLVECWQLDDAVVGFWCGHCRSVHVHGNPLGEVEFHRSAHCDPLSGSPFIERGYLLRVVGRTRGMDALQPNAPKAKTVRPPMSAKLRFQILRRDGFRCRLCGCGAPEVTLHVDHILAVANGGKTEETNLWALCRDCNLGKGTEGLN